MPELYKSIRLRNNENTPAWIAALASHSNRGLPYVRGIEVHGHLQDFRYCNQMEKWYTILEFTTSLILQLLARNQLRTFK